MNKYKVEITRTQTYAIDVLAENEEIAKVMAEEKFSDIVSKNMEHYHQVGDDDQQTGTVYNVTDTDDPFNP